MIIERLMKMASEAVRGKLVNPQIVRAFRGIAVVARSYCACL